MLAKLAMDLSVNHDRATPDRPGAENWCDFCGHTDDPDAPDGHSDLVPGADAPYFGDAAAKVCADEDKCFATRERRYPLDLARVPDWVFRANAAALDEGGHVADGPGRVRGGGAGVRGGAVVPGRG
jgi:hypothetical protein